VEPFDPACSFTIRLRARRAHQTLPACSSWCGHPARNGSIVGHPMTGVELTALAPVLGVAATSIVLMAVVAVRPNRLWNTTITIAGLAGSFGLLFTAGSASPCPVTPLLLIDGTALFFFGLIIATTAVVVILAHAYLGRRGLENGEFLMLLLFATLGGCILVASIHFASLLLGLEVLSVSLYAMIAYLRDTDTSLEAGVKYLILAAVSSAFLLFGMALVYAHTGDLGFAALAGVEWSPVVLAGVALMMVGVGFKLALVPFHMWTADVYQGAPAPVTAFVATASKAAVVAVLLRLLSVAETPPPQLVWFMMLLAAASIVVGNLLALHQDNLKRLLAYSSIAHLGYLMIAVIAGDGGAGAAVFYLVAYVPTTLAAFGVITVLSNEDREPDRLDDLLGLGARRPALAGLLTAGLLSLAGIPLTAGFIGKFLVLRSGVGEGLWTLALILVLGSVISIFYYLRVVVAMYMRPAPEPSPELPAVPIGAAAVLAVLLAAILWLGVWPGPFLETVGTAMRSLY
jgi:NADH-quinone oxidoreductase subunit N